MNEIINIYYPEQYTFSPNRKALYRTPSVAFASVRQPRRADVPLIGEGERALIFQDVVAGGEREKGQLFAGNCYIEYKGDIFGVTEVTESQRKPGILTLTGIYRFPYTDPEFARVLVGGQSVGIGDDEAVVSQREREPWETA